MRPEYTYICRSYAINDAGYRCANPIVPASGANEETTVCLASCKDDVLLLEL